MTLEQFVEDFKALLMQAIKSGHSVDDIGQLVESVLETSDWTKLEDNT